MVSTLLSFLQLQIITCGFIFDANYGALSIISLVINKPGFRNWVPKIGNCKILGRPNF